MNTLFRDLEKYSNNIAVLTHNSVITYKELISYLQDHFNNIDDIDLVDLGSALGVHSGPGALGVGLQKVIND